jgi:cobalamin biosynthesis protein CobD/CbiB
MKSLLPGALLLDPVYGEPKQPRPVRGMGAARACSQLTQLMSRPTSDLSASESTAAAVESLAENFTDGVLAQLCALAPAGIPGAYVYWFHQHRCCDGRIQSGMTC